MAHDPYANHDDLDGEGAGERLRNAAAEHPGTTALVSLLTSPLALKAGSVALRWARRNPMLAIGIAAGAYVWWSRRQRADSGGGSYASDVGGATRAGTSGDPEYDFPGAAHGSVNATHRRDGTDATSIASSL